MSDSTSSIPPEEGASFLSRDFTQCFAQLRHYDSQIWAICRFAFTAYVAIVGAVIGLYQYSIDRSIDLIPVAMCILSIGIALGFMIYGLIIRNRVYYVFVCRYINEHRGFFLNTQPLGFTNSSGMYVNSRQPPYFNWRSWQSFLAYITALLNAGLTALLVLYALEGHSCRWQWTVALGVVTGLGQIWLGIAYLTSRESKTGSEGIFGKE